MISFFISFVLRLLVWFFQVTYDLYIKFNDWVIKKRRLTKEKCVGHGVTDSQVLNYINIVRWYDTFSNKLGESFKLWSNTSIKSSFFFYEILLLYVDVKKFETVQHHLIFYKPNTYKTVIIKLNWLARVCDLWGVKRKVVSLRRQLVKKERPYLHHILSYSTHLLFLPGQNIYFLCCIILQR